MRRDGGRLMDQDIERRIIAAGGEQEQAARRCLVRLRSEGRPLEEMPAALLAETGVSLSAEAIERVLSEIAGPVPEEEGGDPRFFSGYLGGG